MKTVAMASALTVMLASCQPPPAPDNRAQATTAPAEKDYYADRINALTDQQRDGVLFKAIKDAGGDCEAVTGSAPHAPVQGRHAWTAHCAPGKGERALDWVVILQPGGMMSIVRPGAV